MIGGSPPSVLALPERMAPDAPNASARAPAGRAAAFLPDPHSPAEPEQGAPAPPYTVASVPLEADGRRFGALTMLRTEDAGAYDDEGAPAWGVPGTPGSAGLTLPYAVQRLTDMLNRATAMDHVMAAAELCLAAPTGARALVLASAAEGRLRLVGHSGRSASLVRDVHGAARDADVPAARAVRGRGLFFSGTSGGCGRTDAAALLPFAGDRHVLDLPMGEGPPAGRRPPTRRSDRTPVPTRLRDTRLSRAPSSRCTRPAAAAAGPLRGRGRQESTPDRAPARPAAGSARCTSGPRRRARAPVLRGTCGPVGRSVG